ncbi:MAG: hypothetical protein K2M87_06865 [Muribaculaceae bacterium]|nr:hypothetical protein [Muribaculaceae bacterium]
MKKILFTFLLAVMGCAVAMAGDDIKLVKGSIASLKDGGVGCVVLDMADTQFDGKKPLRKDDRFRNVDEQIPECTSEFIREFNDNSKKFRLTDEADKADYEFYVKLTNLDVYVNMFSFKGGVGIKLWGEIVIKNKKTNEVVAEYKIDEEGNSGFTYQIALEEGFEGIAKFLAKRINKGK